MARYAQAQAARAGGGGGSNGSDPLTEGDERQLLALDRGFLPSTQLFQVCECVDLGLWVCVVGGGLRDGGKRKEVGVIFPFSYVHTHCLLTHASSLPSSPFLSPSPSSQHPTPNTNTYHIHDHTCVTTNTTA